MKQFTLILIALTLTACARDPHQLRKDDYKPVQIEIIDSEVALQQLASEMPITHVREVK